MRSRRWTGLRVYLGLVVAFSIPCLLSGQVDDPREADHEALRALRGRFVEALNGRDFAALEPLVSESVTFVSVDNRKFAGVPALRSYWESLFSGDGAVLESMTVAPEADDKTLFLGPDHGLAQGTSADVYQFKALGRREMPSRWTAVVRKEDGQWRVAHVHMSANVLQNPVTDALKQASGIKAGLGFLVGTLAGGIVGWMLGKGRGKAAARRDE